MGTLLLRLTAPIQAWGDESKYDIRGTRNEPTKSGVIGLQAVSMGYRRDSEEIKIMAEKLRMGIRVDQPGIIIRDFHSARPPKYRKDGTLTYECDGSIIMDKAPYITQRYYLCDACFLVGLECEEEEFLHDLSEALTAPVLPIYLGRRSCPPSLPILLRITDTDLETSLKETEWLASDWYRDKYKCIRARIVTETKKGNIAWHTRMDQPVSYNPIHRRYTLRGVDREQYVFLGVYEHDPMEAL